MDKHLDGIRDPILLVLKGHLLVEEGLKLAISNRMSNPIAFDELNLTFSQTTKLARAMFQSSNKSENPLWDAVAALNTLRNKLMHNLESGDLQPLLDRLVVTTDPPIGWEDTDLSVKLSLAIGMLIGFVSVLGALQDAGAE
jgi:hypothetical protein